MLLKSLIGAIQLDPQAYSDIAADRGMLKQAFVIAAFSSLTTGIGNSSGYPDKIFLSALFAFVAWLAWVLLIYVLGAKLFSEPDTEIELGAFFCIAGFASLPGLSRLLAYFPPFALIVSTGATLWMLAMMTVGVKQVFAYRRMSRAVLVTLLSWPLYQWVISQG